MRLSTGVLTAAALVVVSGLFVSLAQAADVDLYLVYSGKSKKLKIAVKKAIPDGFNVKTYNVNLLVLADYSGVQKAASKIAKAKVVIMLQDETMAALKGSTLTYDLLVVNSVKTTVKSKKKILYVVDPKADTSGLDAKLKRVKVSSKDDLNDSQANIFIVDESVVSIPEAIAIILKTRYAK